MRTTEASCRRRALASQWRHALKAVTPLTGATANAIARKMEPRLRRRFLAAVRQMRGRVDLELLAEAMRVEDAVRAMTALAPEKWAEDLGPLARLLPDVYRMAGASAATTLGSQLSIPVGFDLTNPRAVEFARQSSSRLIVEVTESIRDSVREIVSRSFIEGIPPRDAAREIRAIVGLTQRQATAVANYRLDLIDSGRSADLIDRLVQRYAQQLTNQRALTIARNESGNSSLAGQRELWREAVDKGLLDPDKTRRVFIVTPDDRLCPLCAPMDGQEVGLEKPFRDADGNAVGMPPSVHIACRCGVALSFSK